MTDDVRAHISCLYMAALSKEEKYRELYDNYQLLDRCDAALREAAKHAERVAHLEREHAARELQIKQAQARVTELKDLQRSSNENHARAQDARPFRHASQPPAGQHRSDPRAGNYHKVRDIFPL
ncbi:hypothetical protein ABMX48_36445 [Streptomyces cavourensis]